MSDTVLITTLLVLSPLLLGIEPAIDYLFSRKKGLGLYRKARRGGVGAISAMSWQDFERLCAGYFSSRGYQVQLCGLGGADGGRDLVLRKSGRKTLVQCKHWKGRVGVAIVREMFGVMTADRCDFVIIVATSGFTKDAWAWANGKPIGLMDAYSLVR